MKSHLSTTEAAETKKSGKADGTLESRPKMWSASGRPAGHEVTALNQFKAL